MNNDQLNRSIQQLLDGVINPCDLALLESELAKNPAARELYLDLAEIHSFLDHSEPVDNLQGNIVPMERIVRRQKRRNLRIATMAAAALIVIGLVTMQLFFVKPKVSRLEFVTSPGTQFKLTHPLEEGKEAPQGLVMQPGSRLQLHQGAVKLHFTTGVTSIVNAPADLVLSEENALQLSHGSAWFHVPQKAIGFSVTTDELEIVDLGTEFGVVSDTTRADQVHVFKGMVQVTSQSSEVTTILKGKEAIEVNKTGDLLSIASAPDSFNDTLPTSLPHLHWSFDSPDEDFFHVSGNHPDVDDILTDVMDDHLRSFVSENGKFGNAIKLEGLNTLQTNWQGITGTAPRTVAFWVKLSPDTKTISSVLGWGKRDDDNVLNNTRDFYFFVNPLERGTVAGLSLGAYWLEGITNIADNQWHHVAFVYTGRDNDADEPDITCYVDGAPEDLIISTQIDLLNRDTSKSILNTADKKAGGDPLWMFGHRWGWEADENAIRALDEVYIFEGALSQEAIQLLYQKNSPGH